MYTKNTNFGDFGVVGPHFKTHSSEIWHEGTKQGLPPTSQIW